MVGDWHTPSRVEVLQQSVTGEVCLRLMGWGPKQLLIIVTVNYTASAYSESGALPVSPLYSMQGIAELDPLKYTSVVCPGTVTFTSIGLQKPLIYFL